MSVLFRFQLLVDLFSSVDAFRCYTLGASATPRSCYSLLFATRCRCLPPFVCVCVSMRVRSCTSIAYLNESERCFFLFLWEVINSRAYAVIVNLKYTHTHTIILLAHALLLSIFNCWTIVCTLSICMCSCLIVILCLRFGSHCLCFCRCCRFIFHFISFFRFALLFSFYRIWYFWFLRSYIRNYVHMIEWILWCDRYS